MNCYLCRSLIEDGAFFYNDHGVQVCKSCFQESRRCFICRFPGKRLEEVEGLGPECEFCRETLIGEDADLDGIIQPFFAYVAQFGHDALPRPRFEHIGREALMEMQTPLSHPPPEFIDDFLRFALPVFHRDGAFYLLRRMTKETFVVYTIVQLSAADLAWRHGTSDLQGGTPFHSLARGWAHWVGYEASKRLNYDLERRQLRKWPELGAMGEFERFEKMSHFKRPAEMVHYLHANLNALARKHLERSQTPRTAGKP